MRPIRITVLAFASFVLANPVPSLNDSSLTTRQYEPQERIMTALFQHIQMQASLINNALALHPEPPEPGNKRKLLLGVVGHHFDRITDALERANGLLGSDQRDAVLAAEEAAGCDAECVTEQMSAVVVATGTAAKDSVMKLGLNDLGKFIHPAFGALAATVLALNGIVGGSLTVVSALVNGLFIAVTAGITYLGKLASDFEREQAGGPQGPKTLEIHSVVEKLIQRLEGS